MDPNTLYSTLKVLSIYIHMLFTIPNLFLNLAYLHIDCSTVPALLDIILYVMCIYLENSHPYRVKQQTSHPCEWQLLIHFIHLVPKKDPFPSLFDTHPGMTNLGTILVILL